ncbi:MAG: NAD(P)/FAD-dependent oxidoreductase [Chitinophagales bacterium]
MKKRKTKILIVGAGPAGLSCSLFLSKMKIEHILLEKEKFPRDKVCGDALSGKVIELLKKLDPELVRKLNAETRQVGSWGVNFYAPNGKKLRIPFKQDFDKSTLPPGNISKRIDFDNFLFEEAQKSPYAEIIEESPALKYERTEKGYIAQTAQKEFECNLLIAADGAYSRFAKDFGNITMEPNHYCAGIRAYYQGVSGMDKDNFIELHFLKDLLPGYFWIFPLPNGAANVGLGMRSDVLRKKKLDLKKMLPEVIASNPELKARFQNAEPEGKTSGFGLPLGSKKRALCGDHFMLLGDAASLIDPFTGEGIGNAMFCGMYAAEIANKALSQNDFKKTVLQDYEHKVYKRMWDELKLSRRLQQLVKFPFLFNFVVNKAARNQTLRETISCMFEDLDIRERLKQPSFYFKLIFNQTQ